MNIFTSLFPHLLKTPPALKTQWPNANCLEWKYKKVLALRHSQKKGIRLAKTYIIGAISNSELGKHYLKHIYNETNILYSGATSNTVKKYIKMDKDIIILQDSTKTHIWYIKTKPHNQSCMVTNRSAHQIRTTQVPTVGDGNVS